MTCVWKRRPASSCRWSLWGFLWLALGLGAAPGAAVTPVVVLAPDSARGAIASEKLRDWLQRDARWVRGLPPGQSSLRAGDGLADPARLRRLLASEGQVAPDSVVVLRPVESRLRDRWLARGYFSATVISRQDTIVVNPGPVWQLGVWDLGGEDFPGRDELIETWLPAAGRDFVAAEMEAGIDRVLDGAGERGYPFARWITRRLILAESAHVVRIEASLLPGQQAWLGPVTSSLDEARARRFLARSSGLRTGNLFREGDLARATERLVARDLYTEVDEPQVFQTSAPDTVGIYFPVRERRKVNRLQVILGLSRPAEGASRLSGQVDLGLPNMGGSGRSLKVGWSDDGLQKSRFGFSYLEPLAFGTGLDMGLSVANEVQRASYTLFRLDNNWQLPVVALWGVELGLGWDRTTYPVGDLERTGRVRASGSVLHRRGDRSRSGWVGRFTVENAWRSSVLRPDTTGASGPGDAGVLGAAITQRIYSVDVGGEIWLSRTVSLFGRSAFRQLSGGNLDIPLAEQFRFGGANSLRGYGEDEFAGREAAWGALELRLGRPLGSRLYTFYDLGYFESWRLDQATPDPADLTRIADWPRGYGLGLFARTPGGDLSLAIGFPGTVDFDRAKLHVTLLETF